MAFNQIDSSTYFQSYISTSVSQVSIGALTIIDNVSQNKPNMVNNSYNLFIDDTFISGGYGFSNYEDYINGSYIASSYSNIINRIYENITNIHNYIPNLYIDNNTNINYKRNSYGFIISYDKLITEFNSDDCSYSIKPMTISNNLKYLTSISISRPDNLSFNECNITISYNSNNNFDIINNDSNLKLVYLDPDTKTSVQINTNNYVCNFKSNESNNDISFNKDLTIYTIDNNTNEIYYSQTLKDYIKFQDIAYYCSNFRLDDDYNFRNSDFSSQANSFIEVFGNPFENPAGFKSLIINSKEFKFTPDSNDTTGNYDYLIFNHTIYGDKIEFYFNGIKINNWKCQNININGENNEILSVWQSPQKYIGKRTWNVKIID